jgi:hypothetical protein
MLVLHEVWNVASGGSGTIGIMHMCVGFIFWDVEINNDFEDIDGCRSLKFAAKNLNGN